MNYIYDVVLNFQQNYYDFFEWNKNDNIYHMRKIPIIKTNKKELLDIINNCVSFTESTMNFLNTQNIQAERFNKNSIDKIKNTVILACDENAIAIKFNKEGLVYSKSSLLPDEKDDIIEIAKFQTPKTLNYKKVKSSNLNPFQTRFELENKNFINKELDKIYKKQDKQKITYLYLECFEKEENNITSAYKKLKQEVEKSSENFQKIYNIFNLSKQKEKG